MRSAMLSCALLVCTLAGCSAPRFATASDGLPRLAPPPAAIARVSLKYSNVYLLRSKGGVGLVDVASPADANNLVSALGAAGVSPSDVRVVIRTHGHADHAGNTRLLQKARREGSRGPRRRGDDPSRTQ